LNTPETDIHRVLTASRFGVLATQKGGQPHTSLMAITPLDGIRQLLFATYRSTLKYRSMASDGRVALMIDARISGIADRTPAVVLNAHGRVTEMLGADYQQASGLHLARHPELKNFLASSDCALFRFEVSAYEVVAGTEDVFWHSLQQS